MSLENNIMLGAIGLLLFFSFKNRKSVIENFVDVPITTKVERVVQTNDHMFTVPSNYMATLQPRQAGMVDYGAFIRYDKPASGLRADTMGTLGPAANMSYGGGETRVVEGYSSPIVASSMVQISGGQPAKASAAAEGGEGAAEGEVGGSVDELGKVEPQPIIYDRYVYANQKNRNKFGADFIRGDLPIAPDETCGWFRPSANPATDLRGGALAAMGGINNDTTKELMALQSASMGQVEGVGSGVKYTVEKSAYMSAGGGDVKVKTTSFL